MVITSNEYKFLVFYEWMYNLCDYLTYWCVFFIFYSNNVGSYVPRSDPMIHNPTYLLRSYVRSWFWQPWSWYYNYGCRMKDMVRGLRIHT